MKKSLNSNLICRVCLSDNSLLTNIFTISSKLGKLISDVLMACAPVQITPQDGLPTFLCELCHKRLEMVHRFQTQVLESENVLQNRVQKKRPAQMSGELSQKITVNTLVQKIQRKNTKLLKTPLSISETHLPLVQSQSVSSEYCKEDNASSVIREDRVEDYDEINKNVQEIGEQKQLEDYGIAKTSEGTEKPFKPSCRRVSSKPILSRQENKLVNKKQQYYQCDFCDVRFADKSNLTVHKRKHTGEKPYKCDICEKNFVRSNSLKKHKRIHSGERPYQCDVCNKCFSGSNSLNLHKRLHTGEKPYQCEICTMSFVQSSNLTIHKRKHTGEKPFRCDMCDMCFSQSGNLIVHKRKHTGEKPFQCEVCSKCFADSGSLILHQRQHTGQRPYQCTVCDKRFTHSSNLIVHTRKHTGEKPYRCDNCDKLFSDASSLKVHKRIHTGEKPYRCEICSKCFIKSYKLTVHKRSNTCEKILTSR